MPTPLEHLVAALELAESGERDEQGRLTGPARAAVQAAYAGVGGGFAEDSFFGKCDRDEAGHCKAGDGGDSGKDDDDDEDEGPDPDEVEQYEADYADYEKEKEEWDRQRDELKAAHEEEHAAWQKEHIEWEKGHADYQAREKEREERKERAQADHVGDAADTASEPVEHVDHDRDESTAEEYEAHVQEYAAAQMTHWDSAYGPDGKLSTSLEAAGATKEERARVQAVAEKGRAKVEKAVQKHAKAAEKFIAAEKALEEHIAEMPPEPVEPDDEPEAPEEPEDPGRLDPNQEHTPQEREQHEREVEQYRRDKEQYDKDVEAWEEAHAEWEEAHEEWSKAETVWSKADDRRAVLQEKADDLAADVSEAADHVDEVYGEQKESLSTAVEKVQYRLGKDLDAEEEADEGPGDEPEEPTESDPEEEIGPEPEEPTAPEGYEPPAKHSERRRVHRHCDEGENKGKPGPCPEGKTKKGSGGKPRPQQPTRSAPSKAASKSPQEARAALAQLQAASSTPGEVRTPIPHEEVPYMTGWGKEEVQELNVADLVTDQPYASAGAVAEYIDRIAANDPSLDDPGKLPVVYARDGKYYLVDGNHRVTAHMLLGMDRVRARVVDRSPEKK